MAKTDSLENTIRVVDEFTKERDWEQFHTPKNLTMALSVEVAELLEIFQWSNSGGLEEIKDIETRKKIEEEIADIFIYLIFFKKNFAEILLFVTIASVCIVPYLLI